MFSSVLGEQLLESFRSSWGTNMSAVIISTNCVLTHSGSLQNSILQPTINQLMLISPIITSLPYIFARFNFDFQPNTSQKGNVHFIEDKQLVILKNLLPNIHHKTLLDMMKKDKSHATENRQPGEIDTEKVGSWKIRGHNKETAWSIFQ